MYDYDLRKGASYAENKCNRIFHKLDAEYRSIFIKQFFRENAIFSEKIAKKRLRGPVTIFGSMVRLLTKTDVTRSVRK